MTRELVPADTITVQNDLRYSELLLCSTRTVSLAVRGLVVAMALLSVGGFIWFLLSGDISGISVGIVSALFLLLLPAGLWTNYSRNRALMDNITTTITPQCLISRINFSSSESRFDWTRVHALHRVGNIIIFVLETQPESFICIPLRCFPTGEESQAFVRKSHEYWRAGQAKRHELGKCASDRKLNRLAILRLALVVVLLCASMSILAEHGHTTWQTWALIGALPLAYYVFRASENGQEALLQANQALAANDANRALEICQSALKNHPKNTSLRVTAGYSLYHLGKLEEGMEECKAALEADEKLALGYAGRSYGYRELVDCPNALADIGKALELEPNLSWGFVIRASVLTDMAQYDEALKDCEEAASLEGQYYGAWLAKAGVHYSKNDLDLAKEFAERALSCCDQTKRSPKERATVVGLQALIHSKAGEHEAALKRIAEAVSLDPSQSYYVGWSALVHSRAGRLTEAAKLFDEALSANPTPRYKIGILADRAVNECLLGNLEAAHENADAALEIARRPYPLVIKAALLEFEGLSEQAEVLVHEAVSKDAYCLAFKPQLTQ